VTRMNGSTRFQLSQSTVQRNDCQGNGLDEKKKGKEDPAELWSSLKEFDRISGVE